MLVAAAAGDHDALRWLLDEVAPIVYGFVYARVGGDEGAAEERRAEVARRSLRVVDDARDSDEVAGTAELVERQDEVVRALGRLPALQRQVLVMKYLEDMPVQDIAAVVKRSRVQVQSLLQRGRDGLRRELGGQDA